MTDAIGLDAEAELLEARGGIRCQTCLWIESRPADEIPEWRALLRSGRTTPAIHKVMARRGFAKTENAVRNCRRAGHQA